MEEILIYSTYAAAALGALAVYCAMPRADRPSRAARVIVGAAALGALVAVLARMAPEAARQTYFCIFAALAVGGAARVVTHTRPVYSVVYFVLVAVSTAGLAVLAGAEFLAAALVIVYAGAILVTYVFVLMLAQQSSLGTAAFDQVLDYDTRAREPIAAVIAGFVLIGAIAGVVMGQTWEPASGGVAVAGNTVGVGRVLLSEFAVSVELAGVLLLVAMVGAIALARRKLPSLDPAAERQRPGEIGKHVKPF